MKRVSHMIEFISLVSDDVDVDAMTFEIPVELVEPRDENNKTCGRLEHYTTQQYGDTEKKNLDEEGNSKSTKPE